MKKIWMIVAAAAVVAVGVFVLTTKNTNDPKNGDERTTEKVITQEKVNPSVNSSAAGGEGVATKNTKGHENSENLTGSSGENLSAPVRALIGLDGEERNYNSMMKSIGALSKDLDTDDIAALRDLLTWPIDVFPEGMQEIEINAVKNDVLNNLLKQEELPEAMGYQLVDMFADTESDPVWKDYCVQFMSVFYEKQSEVLGVKFQEGKSGGSGSVPTMDDTEVVPPNDELAAVREAMFAALGDKDETISGTAQIGLELLSRTHEEFDPALIKSSISAVAMDDSVSTKSRQTALRMTTLTGADETTADTARLLAQTSESMLMRSAAVVTLGETGTAEDRELLESYTLSEDRQLAGAAELALQKMEARGL